MDSHKKEEIYKMALEVSEKFLHSNSFLSSVGNIIAHIHKEMSYLWTGIYNVIDDKLELGIFQGSVACTSIKHGRGVCGSAWKDEEIKIVDDVHSFADHIVCDTKAQSEIVIPGYIDDSIKFVLDVDGSEKGQFDSIDEKYLSEIVALIEKAYVADIKWRKYIS